MFALEQIMINKSYQKNLTFISEPYLIERYNNCLFELTGLKTKLSSFSIDSYGYSQEISIEFQNHFYLSKSFNSPSFYFILIDTRQFNSSFYDERFSFFKFIYMKFLNNNKESLVNYLLRNGVYGEFYSNITIIENEIDLKKIEYMKFIVKTEKKILETVEEFLQLKNEFFKNNRCFDKQLLDEIKNNYRKIEGIFEKETRINYETYNVNFFYNLIYENIFIFKNITENNKTIMVDLESTRLVQKKLNKSISKIDKNSIYRIITNHFDLTESIKQNYFIGDKTYIIDYLKTIISRNESSIKNNITFNDILNITSLSELKIKERPIDIEDFEISTQLFFLLYFVFSKGIEDIFVLDLFYFYLTGFNIDSLRNNSRQHFKKHLFSLTETERKELLREYSKKEL